MSEGRRVTYAFGPLERRGVLGGFAAGQLVTLALGVLGAIVSLDWAPSTRGAVLALAAGGLAAFLAFAPLAGRTVHEWTPLAVSHLARRVRGAHRFRSAAPERGLRVTALGTRDARLGEALADPPPQLSGVEIMRCVRGDDAIGLMRERGGRRLTAVLACRVAAFTLLDPEAQERRLARWGLVLSGASAGTVRRLQWIERTAPAQGDELARWVHAERDPAIPLRGSPMLESYLELISASTRVSQEHEVLIAVQTDAARVRDRGRDAIERAVFEAVDRIAQGLEAAEVTVLGALGPDPLTRTLRTAFDPFARGELTTLEAAGAGAETATGAWPLAAREGWDHYVADGAVHATFWISGWPRVQVSPLFMDTLLGHSGAVRTVAVTFEPVPPDRSTREIEAAVTRDRADRELRERFGQSETARQRQSAEATMRREAELAAGHGEVRFSGFITVSGRDPEDLRRACGEVLEHAARARLALRRMYGQQAEAFTFTLPLGRGLR